MTAIALCRYVFNEKAQDWTRGGLKAKYADIIVEGMPLIPVSGVRS